MQIIAILHQRVELLIVSKLLLCIFQIGNLLSGQVLRNEVPVFIAEVQVKGRSREVAFSFFMIIIVKLVGGSLDDLVLEGLRAGSGPEDVLAELASKNLSGGYLAVEVGLHEAAEGATKEEIHF